MLAAYPIAATPIASAPAAETIHAVEHPLYRFVLGVGEDQHLVHVHWARLIRTWSNATVTEHHDEADTLQFDTPYDSDWVQYLVWPRTVTVSYGWGELQNRYLIRRTEAIRDGASRVLRVYGESLMSKLADEFVTTDYSANVDGQAHIEALLAMQQSADPIVWGTVDWCYRGDTPTLQLEFAAGTSLLDALRKLQSQFANPGAMWVDGYGRLYWRTTRRRGRWKRQVRYRKNLRGVTKTTDWSQYYNRIYAYGRGVNGTWVGLTDAGEAHEYVQDTSYDSEIRPYWLYQPDIADADALLAAANAVLEQTASPVITYSVDAIALEHAQNGVDWSHERLYVGDQVLVVDEDLDINVTATVTQITRSLDTPLDVDLEIATRDTDRKQTIADTIAEVLRRVDAEGRRRDFDPTADVALSGPTTPLSITSGGYSLFDVTPGATPVTAFRNGAGVVMLQVTHTTGTMLSYGGASFYGGGVDAGYTGTARGVVTAANGPSANSPGCLKLLSARGDAYFICVGDDGKLRIDSSLPVGPNPGTVVGSQY